jgi:hypothetical protein
LPKLRMKFIQKTQAERESLVHQKERGDETGFLA